MFTRCCRGGIPAALVMVAAGCALFEEKPAKPAERPGGTMAKAGESAVGQPYLAVQGTIGSVTYVEGGQLMRVRGFGLVCGLNGTGSTKCRPNLREYVEREIRRARSATPHIQYTQTPQEIIESPDTAVVMVEGEVPAAAAKGRRFDLRVSAVDEDTKSLAGGILMPCDLKILAAVSPQEVLEGQTHAKAAGRVFINPFGASGGNAAAVNLREGQIIGGGLNLVDRRISLVSSFEAYATVQQIMDSINRRFPGEEPTAKAVSPNRVTLRIPEALRGGGEGRFLELVRHLPLSSTPVELEARAKLLAGQLVRTDVPPNQTAAALEGIGESVLPMIQPLYTHARRQVNYYAARTGLRLGDELAMAVIVHHTKDPKSPFRSQAIRELGRSKLTHQAAAALRELLADDDPLMRIEAYEALRQVAPQVVARVVVGQDPQNFLLEMVPAQGPPLIYARRTGYPCIGMIGGDRLVCQPPLLYSEAGKTVTLSAKAEDQMVTLLRKDAKGMLGPYRAPLSVPRLTQFMGDDLRSDADGKLQGLGLDYAAVLDVLYRLCEKKAINAQMKWEEPSVEELVGPLEPMGRPESEL